MKTAVAPRTNATIPAMPPGTAPIPGPAAFSRTAATARPDVRAHDALELTHDLAVDAPFAEEDLVRSRRPREAREPTRTACKRRAPRSEYRPSAEHSDGASRRKTPNPANGPSHPSPFREPRTATLRSRHAGPSSYPCGSSLPWLAFFCSGPFPSFCRGSSSRLLLGRAGSPFLGDLAGAEPSAAAAAAWPSASAAAASPAAAAAGLCAAAPRLLLLLLRLRLLAAVLLLRLLLLLRPCFLCPLLRPLLCFTCCCCFACSLLRCWPSPVAASPARCLACSFACSCGFACSCCWRCACSCGGAAVGVAAISAGRLARPSRHWLARRWPRARSCRHRSMTPSGAWSWRY